MDDEISQLTPRQRYDQMSPKPLPTSPSFHSPGGRVTVPSYKANPLLHPICCMNGRVWLMLTMLTELPLQTVINGNTDVMSIPEEIAPSAIHHSVWKSPPIQQEVQPQLSVLCSETRVRVSEGWIPTLTRWVWSGRVRLHGTEQDQLL